MNVFSREVTAWKDENVRINVTFVFMPNAIERGSGHLIACLHQSWNTTEEPIKDAGCY